MSDWLREAFGRRPVWMNALLLFCAYMAFVYVPWDFLAKPLALDEEVWFGVRLHGGWAKATEPLHLAIYAAGAYGFWHMRPWMWPWAAVYAAQVAVAMLVWPLLYRDELGGGLARAALFGAISFTVFAALTIALWRARERFRGPRPSLRARYGEWALVTGASAGIGTAFARALAREGMSVVLTARRADRLHALAKELEAEGVATRVVALDLAALDGASRLADAVADLELAILVNNAGAGAAGRFDKLDGARLREMVELNCTAPVLLTRALLPRLLARGRGAVVFTGSQAARQPLPLHAVYAATKAFGGFVGEALWAELRGTGVDVLVVEPGSTDTEFQQVAGELPHRGQAPEEVAAIALERLGRQPSVSTRWSHWLRGNAGMRLLPRSLLVLGAGHVMERQTPPDLR
ncbi:MAG: SDR family NAD(P)-dependent oxidoreductase [Deltaproteobacteria bacterium]|nr:SDR family NAD(P)-dependent oxidoreductase [Deltaproteobacteria bacterium]